ncbi:hypothetical protein TNCV_1047441 [Trichonephila clavipes]|nr:hypothetical protein TNCV_1047441 [Trichonephila clavipes]
MTPVEDPTIVFASAQLILLYLGTAAVAIARRRHALLAKDLVTWQAMVGRHILKDIVGRVAHCQSALKDHYVSQEIAPHTVTPCEIAVCRSTINAGSDRWPVRLQTRVRWSSALRLNRVSSLKTTRLQSVTLKLPEVGKNPVDTAYDVGSVVSVLADVGSSSQLRSVVSLWFLLMALDVW